MPRPWPNKVESRNWQHQMVAIFIQITYSSAFCVENVQTLSRLFESNVLSCHEANHLSSVHVDLWQTNHTAPVEKQGKEKVPKRKKSNLVNEQQSCQPKWCFLPFTISRTESNLHPKIEKLWKVLYLKWGSGTVQRLIQWQYSPSPFPLALSPLSGFTFCASDGINTVPFMAVSCLS